MNARKLQAVGLTLGLAMFTAVGLTVFTGASNRSAEPPTPAAAPATSAPVPAAATAPLQNLSDAFAAVAERVKPAIVSVHSERVLKMRRPDLPFPFQYFFDQDEPQPRRGQPRQREYQYRRSGLGSGFILNREGHIVTNFHVVEDGSEVKVTLADKRTFDAEVIGTDPKTDLAIIKIKGKVPADLPVVPLGDSDAMRVGDWVLAFGAPFGYDQTVTAGIVSAKGRGNVGAVDYEDFIQTDAAINPGNSGGPLVNIRGEVIGINTVIATGGAQQYAGVGFAIPVNMAKTILPTLVKGGTVSRGMLGVVIQDIDEELREQFNLPSTAGALVTQVSEGSPAEKAGLRISDTITSINGTKIQDVRQLRNTVAALAPGTKVTIGFLRNGKEQTVPVTLTELPKGEEQASQRDTDSAPGVPDLGLSVQSLNADLAKQFGHKQQEGLIISEVNEDGPAAAGSLRVGDLITEINREKVTTIKEFRDVLAKAKGRDSVLLLIQRAGASRFVILRLKTDK